MRKIIVLPLALAIGCGDKSEDSGSDSSEPVVEDTAAE